MKVPKDMMRQVYDLQHVFLKGPASTRMPNGHLHETVAHRWVESWNEQEAKDGIWMLDGDIDSELEGVDVESVQCNYEATIMVLNGRGHKPMEVYPVVDGRSRVSCVSEK